MCFYVAMQCYLIVENKLQSHYFTVCKLLGRCINVMTNVRPFKWFLWVSSTCDTFSSKNFWATQVRCLTAATATVTLVFLFVEMLCYVLGRLHSSYVLCTKIRLHRWEFINKTLIINDFSNFFGNFLLIFVKSQKFWKF